MEIWVYCGPDDRNNQEALNALGKLTDVRLRTVGDTVRLAGYVELPYIQTEQRDRYYGLESILEFVHDELAHNDLARNHHPN